VTLTACDVYGQKFIISRIFREAPKVYLDGKLQPGVSIRATVLRRPIYFGQKDSMASIRTIIVFCHQAIQFRLFPTGERS